MRLVLEDLADRITLRLSRVSEPTGNIFSARDPMIPLTSGIQNVFDPPSAMEIPVLEFAGSIPSGMFPFFISRSLEA